MAGRGQDPARDVPSAIRLPSLRELVERHRGQWPSRRRQGHPLELVPRFVGHARPLQGRQLERETKQRIHPDRQHDHQWRSHPGAGNRPGIDSTLNSGWRGSNVIAPNMCLWRFV